MLNTPESHNLRPRTLAEITFRSPSSFTPSPLLPIRLPEALVMNTPLSPVFPGAAVPAAFRPM